LVHRTITGFLAGDGVGDGQDDSNCSGYHYRQPPGKERENR
jgi:hypothetical protein